jgi:pimeloyl-ACP methyl ester carboxylesterase
VTRPQPETFGDIEDTAKPLAVLVHGFPDSPYTWRHLGPHLAERGYRVVAPWLPGYDAPVDTNVSLGTYMRHVLDVRRKHKGDDRAILIGHDWGAHTGYAVVAADPGAFRRYVAMAVPPVAALGTGMFTYRQLKRSFYIWFIQQVGLAETVFLEPGFLESLWADWSPGYDPSDDVAELRKHVTANNIANVICPYRASFNPQFADPDAQHEEAAAMQPPQVPTLYLHGATDGGMGADLLGDFEVSVHLPVAGSAFEIVAGVGHFLHLEQPEAIAARIVDWLDA